MNIENIDYSYTFPQYNYENVSIELQLRAARKKIFDVQTHQAHNKQECFLSFYPVAKNLRFVSTHFFQSILNNQYPTLSQRPRNGEVDFWQQMTGQSWFPWLWVRYFEDINKNESIKESWGRLFKNIEDIVSVDISQEHTTTNVFYLYLACLEHVFRFNDDFKSTILKKYQINFPDEPVCALQIRRGEIVPKDGDINKSWKIRKLFTLDEYMTAAETICAKLRTNTIFLSSDSHETIDYLRQHYSNYNFLVNKYDKNLFIRFGGNQNNVNLERDLQLNPKLIKHYTESCLVDLLSLSQCQGYVGGMKYSEYGLCGWFLQMINQKSVTPYYNLEGELQLNGHPVGLLLN